MKSRLTLAALALTLAVGACDRDAPTSPAAGTIPEAEFQNASRQFGLVNVSTGNIELLNNVNLAVAANVIANVCDITIGVAALAAQLIADEGETTCTGSGGTIDIEQTLPGENPASGPGGGNQSRQAGLINVSLGNVEILNDVNAAVAANVLVNACDLTIAAAILAVQGVLDGGTTTCETTTEGIFINQSQA